MIKIAPCRIGSVRVWLC